MNNTIEKIVLMAFGLIVLGTVITPAIMACALSNWRFFLLYPAASVLIFTASAIFGKKS